MPNKLSEKARHDAVSHLTADLRNTDAKMLKRLKSLTSATIASMPAPERSGAIVRAAGLVVDAETRKEFRGL